jgi:putative redox protein
MAKAFVILKKDSLQTTIQTRHHTYNADEPVADGGTDSAVGPVEMTMGALGSCIAMTMKLYADRKQWPLDGVEIEVEVERFNAKDYDEYNGDARYIHEIRKKVKLLGDLTDEQRTRILEIGGKCPVHQLIATPTFFKEILLDTGEPFEIIAE